MQGKLTKRESQVQLATSLSFQNKKQLILTSQYKEVSGTELITVELFIKVANFKKSALKQLI